LNDVGDADFTIDSPGAVVAGTVFSLGGDVCGWSFGSSPVTVAELKTDPASTSACVVTYVAVHVVDAPGASVVTGQTGWDTPGRVSLTTMLCNVTSPVLATRKLYEIVCPPPVKDVGNADFTIARSADGPVVMVADDGGLVSGGPDGGVPVAVAVLVSCPALTSAWVAA
jgi:hypothetical protein